MNESAHWVLTDSNDSDGTRFQDSTTFILDVIVDSWVTQMIENQLNLNKKVQRKVKH